MISEVMGKTRILKTERAFLNLNIKKKKICKSSKLIHLFR